MCARDDIFTYLTMKRGRQKGGNLIDWEKLQENRLSHDIKNRLSALRAELKKQSVDGFIIPHTDEFGSEYLADNTECLAWITGFDGSSGTAVVLQDKAMAMTDGRYVIQIKRQVDAELFEIRDMKDTKTGEWIAENAVKGAIIGYDPKLHTSQQIKAIEEATEKGGIKLHPLTDNPVYKIWTDRPSPPQGIAEIFPDDIAGATSAEKRNRLSAGLKAEKISAVVMTLPDSICWLLNIRGSDVDYNPLVLSYAVLHDDARLDWYVEEQKIPEEVKLALGEDVKICNFESFESGLSSLKGLVQYDDQRSSVWIYNILKGAGIETVAGKDPCIMPKACKTAAEQLAIRQAHIRDGLAFVRFMLWFEQQDLSKGHVTELVVEEKLEEFRKANRTYRGPSFNTIAGWNANGAIIHYRATPETNQVITGNGFLLIDSGGQYEYGTTDITRVFVVGDVTPEMKDRYTRVLKGHIALATAKFTPETDGIALDNLARQPLIDEGLNFAHGTGHGVGCFLCVHEEASSISPRGTSPFRPGMLVSNEPGYYKEGEYGIRHENLILCQEDEDGNYYFDTVTVVPFDTRAIDWDLMTDTEKEWLANYHRHVFEILEPFLDEVELPWLADLLLPPKLVEENEEEAAFNLSAFD